MRPLVKVRSGPSPQVRGTVLDDGQIPLRRGTIPAGAGNSRIGKLAWIMTRDHPRRCGEQRAAIPRARIPTGPSPQVRGTGSHNSLALISLGTIPAGAGNSVFLIAADLADGDHPRRCGEQFVFIFVIWLLWGPSPQVRGTVVSAVWRRSWNGTIPAGAGNSAARMTYSPSERDHPRRCGEQWLV